MTTSAVTVQPSGLVFSADVGETVFAAARRNGLRWPTVCGGEGTCHTCAVEVLDGDSALAPPDDYELEQLDDIRAFAAHPLRCRLACQARIAAPRPVVVHRTGVRRLAALVDAPDKN